MKYRRPGWGRPNTDTWPTNPHDTFETGPSEQPAKRQKTRFEKPKVEKPKVEKPKVEKERRLSMP